MTPKIKPSTAWAVYKNGKFYIDVRMFPKKIHADFAVKAISANRIGDFQTVKVRITPVGKGER